MRKSSGKSRPLLDLLLSIIHLSIVGADKKFPIGNLSSSSPPLSPPAPASSLPHMQFSNEFCLAHLHVLSVLSSRPSQAPSVRPVSFDPFPGQDTRMMLSCCRHSISASFPLEDNYRRGLTNTVLPPIFQTKVPKVPASEAAVWN